jgi:hypothetical protein
MNIASALAGNKYNESTTCICPTLLGLDSIRFGNTFIILFAISILLYCFVSFISIWAQELVKIIKTRTSILTMVNLLTQK